MGVPPWENIGEGRHEQTGNSVGWRDKSNCKSANHLRQEWKSNYTKRLAGGNSCNKKSRKNKESKNRGAKEYHEED